MDPILMGFDKRKLPSPGFQVEVVMPARSKADTAAKGSDGTTSSGYIPKPSGPEIRNLDSVRVSDIKADASVFSFGDEEDYYESE
ncbi:hypothetical protein GH714_032635 [Hevea brasiliensis]|uniref:Uncharacterized protein n=1 Tax=Hevea brasiliensis TaxID=3981 RepID=A0A6A6L6S4_HEVBR|nr:hypothetical protein GH714_032635 [Hevea brasiliensis]